jgi:hypothetical protein
MLSRRFRPRRSAPSATEVTPCQQAYNVLVQPPSTPIIVKIVEAPVRGLGLGDVILNAVGLTGALAIAGLALGLILAGVVITYRRAKSGRITEAEASQTQSLGLTPPAHQ